MSKNEERLEISPESERAEALEAVLMQADQIGLHEAIEKFGDPLTDTDKKLVKSLTSEEIKSLSNISRKIGLLARRPVNNNNNNNNKPK